MYDSNICMDACMDPLVVQFGATFRHQVICSFSWPIRSQVAVMVVVSVMVTTVVAVVVSVMVMLSFLRSYWKAIQIYYVSITYVYIYL